MGIRMVVDLERLECMWSKFWGLTGNSTRRGSELGAGKLSKHLTKHFTQRGKSKDDGWTTEFHHKKQRSQPDPSSRPASYTWPVAIARRASYLATTGCYAQRLIQPSERRPQSTASESGLTWSFIEMWRSSQSLHAHRNIYPTVRAREPDGRSRRRRRRWRQALRERGSGPSPASESEQREHWRGRGGEARGDEARRGVRVPSSGGKVRAERSATSADLSHEPLPFSAVLNFALLRGRVVRASEHNRFFVFRCRCWWSVVLQLVVADRASYRRAEVDREGGRESTDSGVRRCGVVR